MNLIFMEDSEILAKLKKQLHKRKLKIHVKKNHYCLEKMSQAILGLSYKYLLGFSAFQNTEDNYSHFSRISTYLLSKSTNCLCFRYLFKDVHTHEERLSPSKTKADMSITKDLGSLNSGFSFYNILFGNRDHPALFFVSL